jgi:hypothetical protein
MLDEKAPMFKVQCLYEEHDCRCGGYKREGKCALPREVWLIAIRLPRSKVNGMIGQKSAAGIVCSSTEQKAQT